MDARVCHALDVLAVGNVQHGPSKGRRTSMLTGHEKSNEDVGDLVVGDLSAVAVTLLHERVHDIVLLVLYEICEQHRR